MYNAVMSVSDLVYAHLLLSLALFACSGYDLRHADAYRQ